MIRILLLIGAFCCMVAISFSQTKIEKQFYQGNYQQAFKLVNEKIESGHASSSDYLMAAQCQFQQFDFGGAELNFQKLLEFDSLNQTALEGLADSKLNLGKKKEAFDILKQLYLLDSTNTRISCKRGNLMLDFDQFKEAEKIFSKLCQLDSSNIFFKRKLVTSVYKQNDFKQTVSLDSAYLLLQHFDIEMKMVMANSFQKLNQLPKSLKACFEILKIDSLYQPAISKIAYINFSNYRNYNDGLIYYRLLNRLEKYSDPFHLKNLGICEYFNGDHEYAASLLDSLSDEINDDPIIPFYAGLSYKKMGNTDKTLLFLERAALIVVPFYAADIYHHLGRAYSAKRMPQEAIKTYQKVIENNPENIQVIYDMAVIYDEFKMGSAIALAYYEQFVRRCDNSTSTDLEYAQIRIKLLKEELFFEGK